MKRCPKCDSMKSFNSFAKNKTKKDGYSSLCKECINSYKRKNRAKYLSTEREYRSRNRDKINARNRANYDPEYSAMYYQANKEIYRKNGREWKKNNRDKVNADKMQRIARLKQRTVGWADKFLVDLQYAMARKMTELLGTPYHVDHMVPLSGETVSGFHTHHNLRVIKGRENMAKSNKHWPNMWS